MTRCLAILGSTGSIGVTTLNVVRHLAGTHRVGVLVARANIDLLVQQIAEFHPSVVVVSDPARAAELRRRVPDQRVLVGMEGICEAVALPEVDMVVAAMSGTAGVLPVLKAIEAGKTVALANKEALVSAGGLVMSLARSKGVPIIPIDSEHSALFQCLEGQQRPALRKLIITCSGGPFRLLSNEQMRSITPQQALRHPNYAMGAKITVDSSTLMNKGLEVLEAHWLFGVPLENIEVVVHPQQILHGMAEFVDGSIIAQMGEPTMWVPIQYALTYPDRLPGALKPFDWTQVRNLEFTPPDTTRFRCLALAYHAGYVGGTLPCYMNAVNEVLVDRFVRGELSWKDISDKLEQLMLRHQPVPVHSVEDVLSADRQAREEATVA